MADKKQHTDTTIKLKMSFEEAIQRLVGQTAAQSPKEPSKRADKPASSKR
jgi:hypothetical protein